MDNEHRDDHQTIALLLLSPTSSSASSLTTGLESMVGPPGLVMLMRLDTTVVCVTVCAMPGVAMVTSRAVAATKQRRMAMVRKTYSCTQEMKWHGMLT